MNRIKTRLAWASMLLVAACALGIGATRDSGPSTQAERIDAITERLACPTCDGESVYVSRASAAESIRNQVARDVAAGRLTDDEIIAAIADRFKAQVLLVPRATGFDSLVWIVPVVVLVVSVAALAGAFRRWRDERPADATAADEELVGRLLSAEPGTGRDDPS